MKEAVVIKSFHNGITLLLDEESAMEEILEELAGKFSKARDFFGTVNMAISMEGRQLSEEEEIRILQVIKKNSDVNIICIVGRNEETNKTFIKAMRYVEKKLKKEEGGQFYRGCLRNHDILETENSIIILGDVYPGSTVISSKNIIVLGGLYGEAYAGGNGMWESYVVALEMTPKKLKIGDFKYELNTKTKWGIYPKVQPKIAYVKNSKIVFEPLTKELLGFF